MRNYKKSTINDLITLTSNGELHAADELRRRVTLLENNYHTVSTELMNILTEEDEE